VPRALNTITNTGRGLDRRGRIVGRLSRRELAAMHVRAREARRAGLGAAFDPSESFGAEVYELLHPGRVQEEYRAVGKEAPSVSDIMTGAASAAAANVEKGAADLASGILSAGKWIIVGLVVVGGIIAVSHLPIAWHNVPREKQ